MQPRKPKGWCNEHGVEHSWRELARSAIDAPMWRECVNCGHGQKRDVPPIFIAHWVDV